MVNKVQRRIDWSGEDYTFTRIVEDEYHREQGEITITVKGLYHKTHSYQTVSSKEGSVTSQKPKPMILCLYNNSNNTDETLIEGEENNAQNNNPQLGDKVVIGGKTMFVTGVEDIQEQHKVLQVSLEVEE
jgi:hypothetical protein